MVKALPRLSRLHVWKYLHIWDVSAIKKRNDLIAKFIEDYTTIEPIDTDVLFSRAGGLLFTRFTVGMQLAFSRKKPVWNYFQALGIFVKSLQGERYVVEFVLMGALITTFEVLRVDEMKDKDKSYVFQFLIRMIEGCGGTRVKEFICSDTSYLESVVDGLTMCKNHGVIHNARLFLQNMCQGNMMGNICMVSKYVISLLPCDFNPKVQALACRVLPIIIHQNAEIASHCYTLVVDCLKTDYNEMLVDVGELCLAMMETPTANDLLTNLMESALPVNVLDNLQTREDSTGNFMMGTASASVSIYSTRQFSVAPSTADTENKSNNSEGGNRLSTSAAHASHDTYFRLQYGAVFTLSYMLKNRPHLADWMAEKGIVGSTLAAIGTAPYAEIQLQGIRLLLLIHELSPDCSVALQLLVPKNLLIIFLSEVEDALQYLTAPICVSLRKIGRAVMSHWREWFTGIALPTTVSLSQFNPPDAKLTMPPDTSPVIHEINRCCETLAELTSEGLSKVTDVMPVILLDDAYREYITSKSGTNLKSSVSAPKVTLNTILERGAGEAQILADPNLEGFRKYLVKGEGRLPGIEGDFEKLAAGYFGVEEGVANPDDGSMTDVETALLEDALKVKSSGVLADEEEEEEGEEGGGDEGNPTDSHYGSIPDEEEGEASVGVGTGSIAPSIAPEGAIEEAQEEA